MQLKTGAEDDFENWKKKMKNQKRVKVLSAVEEIGGMLDDGMDVKGVVKTLSRCQLRASLTLNDVGYIALAVSLFHKLGDKFRYEWNLFWTEDEDYALNVEVNKLETVFDPS